MYHTLRTLVLGLIVGVCLAEPMSVLGEGPNESTPGAGQRTPEVGEVIDRELATPERTTKVRRVKPGEIRPGGRMPEEGPSVFDDGEKRPFTGRRRGGPGEPDGPPPPILTEEEVQEIRSFIKEHFPEQYERLAQLKERDPELVRRMAGRLWPRVHELMLAYRRNPELGKLMVEDHKIEENVRKKLEEFREAKPDALVSIRGQIQALMAQQFDIRQKRRAIEIAELEQRLAEQKKMLEERSANKESIIAKELERRLHPEMEF